MFKQLPVPALLGVDRAGDHDHPLRRACASLPRLGLTVAAYLAAASILPLIGRNPLRAPLATWGMVVAHFGIAVALAGMAANAAFTSERLAVARPGETLSVGPWLVQLRGRHADGRQELDRDGGRAARDARRRARSR